MFTKNNQIKSIKWKHAFLVVLVMHGVGYLSIAQYSNYKKQKTLELKKARETLYTNNETKTIEWPKNEKNKPVVVAVPKELYQKKNEIKIKENAVSEFIEDFQNFFNKKIELPKIPVQIAKPKPTPTPKKVYASSVPLKPVARTITPIEYVKKEKEMIVTVRPTPIPVKKAIAIEPERRVVKSQTKHYSKPSSNFSDMDWGGSETVETVEVVQSYIVLQ